MCIIAISKPGQKFFDNDTIKTMWRANPDGAGIMYTIGGNKVIIEKGFMKLNDLYLRLDALKEEIDVEKQAVVLHFRIGTHGGNVPANTHPFPMTNKVEVLQKLFAKTDVGIVHNGIIPIKPSIKTISDTMEYIKSVLWKYYDKNHHFYNSSTMMKWIEEDITSKMAFLLPDGTVHTIGKFIADEDGRLYSNDSYLPPVSKWSSYLGGLYSYTWDDDGEYDEEEALYIDDLMPVDDDTYIVNYETGNLMEYDVFGQLMIDADGNIYQAEMFEDGSYVASVVESDIAIFNNNGTEVRYDPDKAIEAYVDMTSVFYG